MSRVWKFGDSVNTDDILPGKFAPFMAGEDVFQTFAFHYVRPEFAAEVREGDVLIGGRNWGLGSSREYAPQALKKLRIGGIVAPSFARIHYRNLLNLGIPAFEADLTGVLNDGDEVSLDAQTGVLTYAGGTVQLPPPPEFLREALKEGSTTGQRGVDSSRFLSRWNPEAQQLFNCPGMVGQSGDHGWCALNPLALSLDS